MKTTPRLTIAILRLAMLSLLGAAAPAQTYKILHHFTGVTSVGPRPLVASGQTLFGATGYGGAGSGSVFKLTMDGSGFETLRAFNSPEGVCQSAHYCSQDPHCMAAQWEEACSAPGQSSG